MVGTASSNSGQQLIQPALKHLFLGPSINHFGTSHLWGKSFYTNIIEQKNVQRYQSQCSKFFYFAEIKKNDKVRAIFGTYSKLIHPDCHPTLHPLFFEIQTSFLSDTFQYFEHFLIYNVSSQSVPSGPIGTTKLTKVFNLWTKISEEL